jgi:UDP-glucose 4-epimerase
VRKEKSVRILVTGGAGFIGSHIVEAYLAEGHEVAVVDNLWRYGGGRLEHLPAGVRYYPADISDARALADVFTRERPEVVNHQAAQHSVKISTDDPIYDAQVNVLGLLNVLEQCRRVGTRKIIIASSGATYGAPERMPISEDTPQLPESPYGITKMAAEHYLRYYHAAHGLDYTAFRYGNIYGPRQDPNGEAGVIAIFAHQILADQPVRIDWDGEQARDYVYVGDAARASVLALTAGSARIFCLGTGTPTSVNEVHRRLVEIVGHATPIVHAPKRAGDVHLACLDSTLAREELGWVPEVDLEQGLRLTVEYFRRKVADEQGARPIGRAAGARA